MIARPRAAQVAVLVVLAVALTAGYQTPASPATDTTPPILRLVPRPTWSACQDFGPTLPRLIAYANDDVGVDSVSWSTGSGDSGSTSLVCPEDAFLGSCYWEARPVPLVVGSNTITVTARDAAGNTSSMELEVTGRASTSIHHLDCSQPAAGDGSMASPFNDLQTAISASCPGDTIQVEGGECVTDVSLPHGLIIQGNPALSAPALGAGRTRIFTTDPVTWRHLSRASASTYVNEIVGSDYDFGPAEVLLEDVRNVSLLSSYPLPRYIVRGSDNIDLSARSGGTGMLADVRSSTQVGIGGCYSGGQATIRVRDSQIRTFYFCDHGYFDILVERSTIEAGAALIQQVREGGCCSLDLTIRDSVIHDTQLLVERASYCAGSTFCPPPSRPSILLERNRFLNSTLEVRAADQGSLPVPTVADLVVQNNIMVHSGIKLRLYQEVASWDSTFSGLIRHNTFIESPTAVEVSVSAIGGPPPIWRAEIANNIIVGSDTGVRVVGDGPDLVIARVAGNDFFQNGSDMSVDQPTTFEGNLFLNPRLQHPIAGDLSLRPNSPCIDNGVDVLSPPESDFLRMMRSLDGDKDGIARPDIGALEFVPRRLHRRVSPTPTEP